MIEISFREIAVTIRAVNRASAEFSRIQTDAEALGARIKSVGAAIASIGATAVAITHIAHQFGLLNDEQARVASSLMSVVTMMGMFIGTSTALAMAQAVYKGVMWLATTAQNAFNISLASGLALTVVGIGAVAAATIAMWKYTESLNAATSSVQSFNDAHAAAPSNARSIQRAGEQDLYRQGVEEPP